MHGYSAITEPAPLTAETAARGSAGGWFPSPEEHDIHSPAVVVSLPPRPPQEEAEEEDEDPDRRKRRRRDASTQDFASAQVQAAGEGAEEANSYAYGVVQHFQRQVIALCLHPNSAIRAAALRLLDRVAETGALQPSLYVNALVAAQIDPNDGCRHTARVLLAHHVTGPAAVAFKGHLANGISRAVGMMHAFSSCLPFEHHRHPAAREQARAAARQAAREGVAVVYDLAKENRAVRNKFIDGAPCARGVRALCPSPSLLLAFFPCFLVLQLTRFSPLSPRRPLSLPPVASRSAPAAVPQGAAARGLGGPGRREPPADAGHPRNTRGARRPRRPRRNGAARGGARAAAGGHGVARYDPRVAARADPRRGPVHRAPRT